MSGYPVVRPNSQPGPCVFQYIKIRQCNCSKVFETGTDGVSVTVSSVRNQRLFVHYSDGPPCNGQWLNSLVVERWIRDREVTSSNLTLIRCTVECDPKHIYRPLSPSSRI